MRQALRIVLAATVASAIACAGPRGEIGPGWPVTTHSREARALFAQGLRQFDLLRMTAARQSFERAIALDPALAVAHAYHALAMNSTGDVEGELQKAVELGAKASPSERLVIEACRRWNRHDDPAAIAALNELVRVSPTSRQAWLELGIHHYDEQEWEQAATALRRAIEVNRTFTPAWIFLARAEARWNRPEEARRAIEEALRLEPRAPLVHFADGETRLQAGDCRAASAAFTEAIALDPAFVPAYERCERYAFRC